MRYGVFATTIAIAAGLAAVIVFAGGFGERAGSSRSDDAPGAPGAGGGESGPLARIRALADVQHIAPGQSFHIAVVFDIQPKWHIYWKNPGVGAGAPRLDIKAPEGFVVGEPRWPRPRVFAEEMGEAYGYEGQAVIFVPVTAPQPLSAGDAKFTIEVNWAVCSASTCKLEKSRCETRVPAMPNETDRAASTDPVLAKFQARLPLPLSLVAGRGGEAKLDGGVLTITAPAEGRTAAHFIPDYSPGVSYDVPTVVIEAGRVRISVPVEANAENSLGRPMFVGGLLALGERDTDPCFEFTRPIGRQ